MTLSSSVYAKSISYHGRAGIENISASAQSASSALPENVSDSERETAELITLLNSFNASDLFDFLESITANNYDAFTQNLYSMMDIFSRDKQSRLRYVRATGKTGEYFSIVRNSSDFDQLNGRGEFATTTYGGNMGIDKELGDKFVLGAGVTYTSTDIDFKDPNVTQSESETFIAGMYGHYKFTNKWYLDSQIHIGTSKHKYADNLSQRGTYYNSNTPYEIMEEFESDYRSYFMDFFLEGGYRLNLPKKYKLLPFVSLEGSYIKNTEFNESSESILALDVEGNNYEDISFGLGTVLTKEFKFSEKVISLPEISFKWLYDLDGNNREIKSSFAGIPNSEFVSYVGDNARGAFLLDIGLTIKSKGNYSVKLNYFGRLSEDTESSEFSFDINFKF